MSSVVYLANLEIDSVHKGAMERVRLAELGLVRESAWV